MKNKTGFTLVELMIVVAVIAILVAIAYPSYQNYRIRTNRADVKTELMRVSQRLQSYYVINHNYTSATITSVGGTASYPSTGTAYYTVGLTVDTDGQGYTLTATPVTGTVQASNGVVCLNQSGYKYWVKGATSCTLSISSTWDD